jgi:uncharacterized alkaline shock family protein YloU
MIRLGHAQVEDSAFESIVHHAVAGVPGARLDTSRVGRVSRVLPGRRAPVEWRATADAVSISLELLALHGSVLPELGADVRRVVAGAVTEMTGLRVDAVDVTVVGIDREAVGAG